MQSGTVKSVPYKSKFVIHLNKITPLPPPTEGLLFVISNLFYTVCINRQIPVKAPFPSLSKKAEAKIMGAEK